MRSIPLLLALALVVSGCARFDDRLDEPFTPVPGPGMGAAPPSQPPGAAPSPPPSGTGEPEPPPREEGPCADPDPAVIATCLEPAVAVAGLGDRALVAESTGGVRIVAPDTPPEEFGRVDPGAGRVVAVAPSPDFSQDRLVYLPGVGDDPSRIGRHDRGATAPPAH